MSGKITPPQMPFDRLRTGFVGGGVLEAEDFNRLLLRSHVAIALATARGTESRLWRTQSSA